MFENFSLYFQKIMSWWSQLPWNTVSFSDWIQIVVGVTSLIVTAILTVVIYKMQTRHEREMEKLDQKRHEAELANLADRFLIDNEAEIEYLPWCVLASSLHRHEKHTRKIYTSFCRCSNELQNKILEVANYDFHTIPDDSWVNRAFEALTVDIQNHELGRNILYDNGKYFFRAFTNYRELEWKNLDFVEMFEPIATNLRVSSLVKKPFCSLGKYISEYFDFRYSDTTPRRYNPNPTMPIDYLCHRIDFEHAEEPVVCAWTMELVKEISLVIHNSKYTERRTTAPELDYTDAQAQTYEDHYYEALQALYNTYYTDNEMLPL